MGHPYWPLFDLRVRTPRLELRPPDEGLDMEMARLAGEGIHDPAFMPFTEPWTDVPSPQLERNAVQHYWRNRAEWTPERWFLRLAVIFDGHLVGTQDVHAERFAVLRTVNTGSWLGRAHQGKGIGKEMRAAALHLAFEGLGAVMAYSGAYEDNAPSLAVSAALGYEANGDVIAIRRDQPARLINLKLPRERWQRRDDITIENLEPCLGMFGLG
jgi:RimJ/RimL family protein N-acetyltransferase